MGVTAAVALAAGSMAYQADQARIAKSDAQDLANQQKKEQERLIKESKDKEAKDQQAARMLATRNGNFSSRGTGASRSGTNLTSHLAMVTTPIPAGGKTLLGA